MSYTDGMPYDAVFEIVEGQIDLTMHPKFQNQTVNVGNQRLAVPAGVSRVMATWGHAGQAVSIQWAPITTEGGFVATGWRSVSLSASNGPVTKQITIPTVHGAIVRVQTVNGVPNEGTVTAKPTLGLEVYPSLNSAVKPE